MQSIEQRSAFRIPLPEGQKHGTLRIEGRSFDVQLLDASSTGVAIACPLQVTLEIDDHCELHTAAGSGGIRIVRKEVFSDGILLGAMRTGDVTSSPQGVYGQLSGLLGSCTAENAGFRAGMRSGLIAAGVLLVGGLGCAAWQLGWLAPEAHAVSPAAALPTALAVDTGPAVAEARESIESAPAVTPVVSESDQRAIRIFEQQKQLLSPDTARRLKLSPVQESEIQRALQAAEAAADSPEFWDAIRRSEQQILRILTPTQIKAWRQQSGT